jgi:tetratricopeptide (TPR) repeat protein
LQHRTMLPLGTLLAVERNSPDYNVESKQGMFYAQSWALVHYLMVGKGGARRPQLAQYLNLVAGGASIDESFRSAFQTDYASLERELFEYLRLFTMGYYRVTLTERIGDDRVVRGSPVSEGQAAAYRGDLLLHMGRADVAEKELATAMALDPALPGPYASMGVLRLREKKEKEALDLFARAAQSDGAEARTHLLYAQLLERTSAGDGEAERSRALGNARASQTGDQPVAGCGGRLYSAGIHRVDVANRADRDGRSAAEGQRAGAGP